jgi:hypothetical protein
LQCAVAGVHYSVVRALLIVVLAFATAFGFGGAATAATPQSEPNPYGVVTVTVAKGTWHGTAWTLEGGDKGSGQQFAACAFVELAPEPFSGGGGCGMGGVPQPHPNPAAPDFPYGVTPAWASACARHRFGVLMGEVTTRARELTITFSTGATVQTLPYSPPAGLLPTVGFFATTTPCVARVTAIVGRDANGKVVARMTSRFLHMP